MNFKDELIRFKKELEKNPNYNTKYISEEIKDDADLERRTWIQSGEEKSNWNLYNSRRAIDESKPQSLKKVYNTINNGIKEFLSIMLDKKIEFESIDMFINIYLFVKENSFKNNTSNKQLNVDDFLLDTIHIKDIAFSVNGGPRYNFVKGNDIVVSYSTLLKLLNSLGFTSFNKSFETLIQERINSKDKDISLNHSLSFTSENKKQL